MITHAKPKVLTLSKKAIEGLFEQCTHQNDVIVGIYKMVFPDWDNIENYTEWLTERLVEVQRVLKDNGTMWLFHTDFLALLDIQKALDLHTDFKFKQFITINKGLSSIAGRTSENLRSYPRATEYLLFYTFED